MPTLQTLSHNLKDGLIEVARIVFGEPLLKAANVLPQDIETTTVTDDANMAFSAGDYLGIMGNVAVISPNQSSSGYHQVMKTLSDSSENQARDTYLWVDYITGGENIFALSDGAHLAPRKEISSHLSPAKFRNLYLSFLAKNYPTRMSKREEMVILLDYFAKELIGLPLTDELYTCLSELDFMLKRQELFILPKELLFLHPEARALKGKLTDAFRTFIIDNHQAIANLLVENPNSLIAKALIKALKSYGINPNSREALNDALMDLDTQELMFLADNKVVRSAFLSFFPFFNLIHILEAYEDNGAKDQLMHLYLETEIERLTGESESIKTSELNESAKSLLNYLSTKKIRTHSGFSAISRKLSHPVKLNEEITIPSNTKVFVSLNTSQEEKNPFIDMKFYYWGKSTEKYKSVLSIYPDRPKNEEEAFVVYSNLFSQQLLEEGKAIPFSKMPHPLQSALLHELKKRPRSEIRSKIVFPDNANSARHANTHFPFGEGKRECPGKVIVKDLIQQSIFHQIKQDFFAEKASQLNTLDLSSPG